MPDKRQILELKGYKCHSVLVNQLILCGLCFPGFYELTLDNRTVSGQTVNVVEHLSLYPELITSFIYRVTGSQVRLFYCFWSF